MDVEAHAERLISEALARGELDPREGSGRPLGPLDSDPDWWVRSFLEREALPDRFDDVSRSVARRIADAIEAETLADARAALKRANAEASAWNEDAPEAFRLTIRSEVWLLDRRAERPAE